MTRWKRARAGTLLTAAGCAALVATAVPARPESANASSMVVAAEWTPFGKDQVGLGMLVPDPGTGLGYAFSGTKLDTWSRVQAVNTATGKLLGKPLAIPSFGSSAPYVFDAKRHVLTFAETYVTGSNTPIEGALVGLTIRGGQVQRAYRVVSPLPYLRLAGLAQVDDDLVAVATSDGASGQILVTGAAVVRIQRLPLGDLAAGVAKPRWSQPIQLPTNSCQTLIESSQPAGVLAVGNKVFVGCHGFATFATGSFAKQGTIGANAGVAEVSGADPSKASPTVATRIFRTAGNFTSAGETIADPRTNRLILVEAGGYTGLRVFDAAHGRYVGRINAGQQNLFGVTIDPRTSRVYFTSFDPTVGVGFGDIEPVVPSQGERLSVPFAAWIHRGTPRRLTFDPATRRLYVPLERLDANGTAVETVLVMQDKSDPFKRGDTADYTTGTLDTVDREGVTDSAIASSSRAYGASYEVIGGTANLIQNFVPDLRGQARPGTRYLRQAYVRSATLTGDGANAYAATAEEDGTTNADRNAAGAGDTFADEAQCSDYGTAPEKKTALGAKVECDLGHGLSYGTATYRHDDGVFVTTQDGNAPYPAPVQVGAATADLRESRPGRDALVTTLTATAENVSILGQVTIGRVVQTVKVTAHGRSGTAHADRTVAVSEVHVGGERLCATSCPLDLVKDRINQALDGRAFVEFPTGAKTVDPHGTYAEFSQDPWYNAERILDYDKATDDFAVPGMIVEARIDGSTKSRLVVELTGANADASYRIYPLDSTDFGGGGGTVVDGGGSTDVPRIVPPTGPGTGTTKPVVKPSQAPQPIASGQGDGGVVAAIVDRVRLSVRSLGEALPLLMIWALLGVPSYLAARRRLLLELPMLTRDEDVT